MNFKDQYDIRKITDVLTNLGLRAGTAFKIKDSAEHTIALTKNNTLEWFTGELKHKELSTLITKAFDIFKLNHLDKDPRFSFRPRVKSYDVKTPFLEEIFGSICNQMELKNSKSKNRLEKPKCTLQITHDVDNPQLLTTYQIARATALLMQGKFSNAEILKTAFSSLFSRQQDPFWCFKKINTLSQIENFKSTFYVFSSYPTRHPRDPRYNSEELRYQNIFKFLTDQGHEIGLHSGINYNNFLGSRRKLGTEPVRSHRAHYWSVPLTKFEEWLDSMALSGITSDSSFSPLTCGFSMGSIYPLYFTSESGKNVLIYPSQFMDVYYHNNPLDGPHIIRNMKKFSAGNIEPVINLNWHVRVFSNIGNWKNFSIDFENIIQTIKEEYDVIYKTAKQSSLMYNLHFKKYKCT